MFLRNLYCEHFDPFGTLDLTFPPVENPQRGAEIHLLVGPNGTGKTRLLNVLSAALGGKAELESKINVATQKEIFVGHGDLKQLRAAFAGLLGPHPPYRFAGGSVGWPVVHSDDSINDAGHETSIGDHKSWWERLFPNVPAFAYSGAATVSQCGIKPFDAVKRPTPVEALSFNNPNDGSRVAQALCNLQLKATQDSMKYGDLARTKLHSREFRLKERLQDLIGTLTGRAVRFLVTDNQHLMVEWGERELSFSLLPDGLRSILGWLVDLALMMDLHYPDKAEPWNEPLIVLLDEVERHLHPGWQRQLVPLIQSLFPKGQFFIATHSPFLISSLNEGWIHNFTFDADGRVISEPPLMAAEGDSYISVLASLMGVTEIYDPETEGLLTQYRTLRQEALRGHAGKPEAALRLADQIGQRGVELAYMMAKESAQLKAQLSKLPAKSA